MDPSQIGSVLLQSAGPLGAVLIVMFFALRHKDKELSTVQEKRFEELSLLQEKRTADAQIAVAKILEVVAAQHANQQLLAKALDDNVDAIRELRLILESVVADRGYNRLPSPGGRRS